MNRFQFTKFQLFRNTANELTTPSSIGRNEKEKKESLQNETSVYERKKNEKKKKRKIRKNEHVNADYSRKVDCRSRDATFVSPGHIMTRRFYRE